MLDIEGRTELTKLKFTPDDVLTLAEKIARNYKGALTAKDLAELLNISRKTVFKMAKAGRILAFVLGLLYALMLGSSSIDCGSRGAERGNNIADERLSSEAHAEAPPAWLCGTGHGGSARIISCSTIRTCEGF